MKSIKLSFLLVITLFLYFSCSEDILNDQDEIPFENSKSQSELNLESNSTLLTNCDVLAENLNQGAPGSYGGYQFTTNLTNYNVVWSIVEGGDMQIILKNNLRAYIYFEPTFNGGTIRALATSNTGLVCSTDFDVLGSSTTPGFNFNDDCLRMNDVDLCEDVQVYLDCASNVQKVEWSYSIGGYNKISFGTQYNSVARSSLYNTFGIPERSGGRTWDNYYVVVYATITLNNGASGTISERLLLDCPSYTPIGPGGGGPAY